MSKRIISLAAIMFIMSGCSWLSVADVEPHTLLLLPPSEGPNVMLLKQTLTLISAEGKHQIIALTQVEKDQLKLRALLPTGQIVLSIDYDGKTLVQHNYSSFLLPSEEILAILQFALWPVDSLKKHYLLSEGWQLVIGNKQRKLNTKTKNIMTITYPSAEKLLVVNKRSNYRINIDLIEQKKL